VTHCAAMCGVAPASDRFGAGSTEPVAQTGTKFRTTEVVPNTHLTTGCGADLDFMVATSIRLMAARFEG